MRDSLKAKNSLWRSLIGLLIIGCLWISDQAQAFHIDLDRHYNYNEITVKLHEFSALYPKRSRVEQVGKSVRGRPIWMLVINQDEQGRQPAVMVNGAHHGNERISGLAALALLNRLHRNWQRKDRALLKGKTLLLIPVVNPDGYIARTRRNARGIDINRDYFTGPPDGVSGFQAPETRAMKAVLASHKVKGAVAVHSGMEGVLWPWGHQGVLPPEAAELHTLARRSAHAMKLIGKDRQSFFDYPTRGEFVDYAYEQHGTLAMTFEISVDVHPANHQVGKLVKRAEAGIYRYIRDLQALAQGNLRLLQPPHPVMTITREFDPADAIERLE